MFVEGKTNDPWGGRGKVYQPTSYSHLSLSLQFILTFSTPNFFRLFDVHFTAVVSPLFTLLYKIKWVFYVDHHTGKVIFHKMVSSLLLLQVIHPLFSHFQHQSSPPQPIAASIAWLLLPYLSFLTGFGSLFRCSIPQRYHNNLLSFTLYIML